MTRAILTFVAIALASSLQAPSAAQSKEPEWREVKSWTGSGMKQTETFVTASREWRIQWRTSNETMKGASILQIYVYNDKGDLLTLAANKQGVGNDVSYVRSPPGKHYLMISSANVDWSVRVEDQR